MLYSKIRSQFISDETYSVKGRIFITKNNKWIIGPYDELRNFATNLRNDHAMIEKLGDLGAIFGERANKLTGEDVAPRGSPQKGGFTKHIDPRNPEVSQAVLKDQFHHQRANQQDDPFQHRMTDQFRKAKEYYQNRTLESHHIVEKSILAKIHANLGDLANSVAPSVLLVAEMHRRLFTPEMAAERGKFKNAMSKSEAKNELLPIYEQLYARPVLSDLKNISAIIINSIAP